MQDAMEKRKGENMPTLKEALEGVASGIVLDATDALGPGRDAKDDYPIHEGGE